MTPKNHYYGVRKLRAIGTLILALSFLTFPAAFSRAVNAQTPAKAGTTSNAESKGGQKEGIKVHGHWTIDVRNPDGTLATHRDFENSLSGIGPRLLTMILARQGAAGLWAIQLQLYNGSSFVAYLEIQEPGDDIIPFTSAPTLFFKTLTVNPAPPPALPPPPSAVPTSLTLSGYTTPLTQGGTTYEVATQNRNCRGTITAAQCASDSGASTQEFTRFELLPGTATPPLTVVAGQIIQVNVVIGFS